MGQSMAAGAPEPLLAATVDWASIAPLVVASLALMGSPGPATISVAAVASAYHVRRSLTYFLGMVIGTTLVLLAVATGVTAAVLAVPALGSMLIALSAAYIVWLAYRIATAPALSEQGVGSRAPSFAAALVLAVVNPKAWVAIAAVFASARLADTATLDAAVKVVVLSVMIAVIMAGWLIAGASLAPLLRDRRRARIVNTLLAAVLVGTTALSMLH